MGLVRTGVTLAALLACSSVARADDPPPGADPVMNEQIADQLVTRAQELLDARIFLDAKQLAVEALVKSPKGPAAERARYIIRVVNQHLNIQEDPPPTPPSQVPPSVNPPGGLDEQVDLTPIGAEPGQFDPSRDPPPAQTPEPEGKGAITAATVHGGLYGGVLGATIGAYANSDNPASVAVPLGIATGLGAALLARKLARRQTWDAAQIRTTGSMNLWGGVLGGFFGQAVTGAGDDKSPTATGVLLGASIGATAGLLTGAALAKNHRLTTGDVALVDTLAGIGTIGGLTMGMLMQPVQNEAYAVNAILGGAGGIVVGVIAGPMTNTTQRRMLRVAGLSAAGGALPFLLYAGIYSSDSRGDERLVGALSSLGLVGGAYLGFRLTRGMDAGLDVNEHAKPGSDDAPAAALRRSSDGTWAAGGLVLQPLSPTLATNQRGLALTLFGASF